MGKLSLRSRARDCVECCHSRQASRRAAKFPVAGALVPGHGRRCRWRGPQWSASVHRSSRTTFRSRRRSAAEMARRTTKTPPPDDGFEERILDIDVVDEMQASYLEYAYSVIYARALPDARDGMKPVHRRIVYQMNEMGLRPDRAFVKCARVVGEVMG